LVKFEREFRSAIKILNAVFLKHQPLRDALFGRHRRGVDFDLVYKMVLETIKRLNYVDACIEKFSRKIRGGYRNTLRLAIVMRKFLGLKPPKLPAELVSIYHKAIDYDPLEEVQDEHEYLALKYYHPTWFIKELMKVMSKERVIKILEANNVPIKKKFVRVNTLRISPDEFRSRWPMLGKTEFPDIFEAKTSYLKEMLSSKDYENGLFIVQNFSSAAVVYSLNPTGEDVILDACAAPGIKVSHIASIVKNKALLLAVEIDARRARMLNSIKKKLGNAFEVIIADSTKPPFKENIFTKILVDAPCSDSGIFREQPDLKWRIKKRDVQTYSTLQKKILQGVLKTIKKGGFIVYSTCSLMPNEGEEVIQWVLEQFNEIELDTLNLPRAERGYSTFPFWNKVARFFPDKDVSGFFIARLIKN